MSKKYLYLFSEGNACTAGFHDLHRSLHAVL